MEEWVPQISEQFPPLKWISLFAQTHPHDDYVHLATVLKVIKVENKCENSITINNVFMGFINS